MRKLIAISTVALLGVICPEQKAQSPAAAASAQVPSYPVIVRLVGRQQTITATAGPNGPLYSARTADGHVIVSNASLDELRIHHPDLYNQLNPAMALYAGTDYAGAE